MSQNQFEIFLSALGSTVSDLRKKQGLTQVGLSQKSGNSQSSIARVERERPPIDTSLRVVFEIARGLSIPPSELLKMVETKTGMKPTKGLSGAPKNWKDLGSAVGAMPKKKQDYLQKFISDLVSHTGSL